MKLRLASLLACVLFAAATVCLWASPACGADDVKLELKAQLRQEEDLSKLPVEVDVKTEVVGNQTKITRTAMLDGVVIGPQMTAICPNDPRIVKMMVESWKKSKLGGTILLCVDGAWVKTGRILVDGAWVDTGRIVYPERADVKRVLMFEGTVSGIKNEEFKITGDGFEEAPQLEELAEGQYKFKLTIPAKAGELLVQGKDSAGKPFTRKYTVATYPERLYKTGKVVLQPGDIFLLPIAKGDKSLVVTGKMGIVERLLAVGAAGNHVVLKAKAAGAVAIGFRNEAGAKRDVISLTVKPDAERTKPEYVKPYATK